MVMPPRGAAEEGGAAPSSVVLRASLDEWLDTPLREYTSRRLAVLLLASSYWFAATDVFVDVYAGHRPDMRRSCVCARPDGIDTIRMSGFNATSTAGACAACAAIGGAPSCPGYVSSMAAEFGIYCGRDWLLGLASSCSIVGVGLGALFGGILSDRFGRRRAFLTSLTALAVLYPLSSAAPTFAVYLCFRLAIGTFVSAGNIALFSLATEIASRRLRTPLTIELWAYQWALMQIFIACVASALRHAHWRQLIVSLSVPMCTLWLVTVITRSSCRCCCCAAIVVVMQGFA